MPITTAPTHVPTGSWSVDPARSRVDFAVRQFGLSTVRGTFRDFEGTLELGGDPAGARAYGSVSVASLDTDHERRDAHLRSPAFLDAEHHPTITFRSTTIRPLDSGALEIAGELTMHGETRLLTLTAELRAAGEEAKSERRLGLVVSGRLDRRDYGVTPNPLLDAVVSGEVELRLDITTTERA